jgi:hypothetical protein
MGQPRKAADFKNLHEREGVFVIPNSSMLAKPLSWLALV